MKRRRYACADVRGATAAGLAWSPRPPVPSQTKPAKSLKMAAGIPSRWLTVCTPVSAAHNDPLILSIQPKTIGAPLQSDERDNRGQHCQDDAKRNAGAMHTEKDLEPSAQPRLPWPAIRGAQPGPGAGNADADQERKPYRREQIVWGIECGLFQRRIPAVGRVGVAEHKPDQHNAAHERHQGLPADPALAMNRGSISESLTVISH